MAPTARLLGAGSGFEYTGNPDDGLWDGSFGRVISERGQDSLVIDRDELIAEIQRGLAGLRATDRDRLTLRTAVRADIASQFQIRDLIGLERGGERAEMTSYQIPGSPGVSQIMIGVNRGDRVLDDAVVRDIHTRVRERSQGAVMDPSAFEQHALTVLQKAASSGYVFDENPDADTLRGLWEQSFGWDQAACEKAARHVEKGQRTFVMREERSRKIVSAILVDMGSGENPRAETSEWATDRSLQGRGLILKLLIAAHAALVRDGVDHCYADLRVLRSDRIGVLAGMAVPVRGDARWLMTRHVTVGDGGDSDSHDEHARSGAPYSDGSNPPYLREFVVGYVDPSLFTKRLQAEVPT